MKWQIQPNGCRLAQGDRGNFFIWSDGDGWHARYISADGSYLLIVPRQGSFILIKSSCEESNYWERQGGESK